MISISSHPLEKGCSFWTVPGLRRLGRLKCAVCQKGHFCVCTKQGLRRLVPLNWFVFEKGHFCFVVFLTKPDLRRLAPVIKMGFLQKRLFSGQRGLWAGYRLLIKMGWVQERLFSLDKGRVWAGYHHFIKMGSLQKKLFSLDKTKLEKAGSSKMGCMPKGGQ